MIGKGTGQPGLDAESHGRNSPATTVRKQEGRELQGQQERRSNNKSHRRSQNRWQGRQQTGEPGSSLPASLSEGGSSVWRGGKCRYSPSSPPASPPAPHQRGNVSAGSGKGSALRPPAGPRQARGVPKPEQSRRRVGTCSHHTAGTETAFPRSPAPALPTPSATALVRPRRAPNPRIEPRPSCPSLLRCWFRGAQSRAFVFLFVCFPQYLKRTQTKPFLKCLPHSSLWLSPGFLGTWAALALISHRGTTTMSPAKQGGFFPSALEAACSTLEHLVAVTQ